MESTRHPHAILRGLRVCNHDMPTTGRIGFQGKHGDAPIWFCNIRIKPLDPEP